MAKANTKAAEVGKRAYLKQSDVPSSSLTDALRLPQVIFDNFAGRPTTPLQVAKALNLDPKGSQIRVLSGAAIAFGLVDGGAQATSITVTELARRILRPKQENADVVAKREAVLKPRIFGDFLRKYDGHPLPRKDIALNVLEEMGVPREKAPEVLERIDASARSVGFLEEIKGKSYVNLDGTPTAEPPIEHSEQDNNQLPSEIFDADADVPAIKNEGAKSRQASSAADDLRRKRVFITHGKNRDLVDPIKKLLEFGELDPVVSVERQSVSKPVPEKVMDDMRGAGAAIIHVDVDRTVVDRDGIEHVLLNPNVLIEIGAAMAFYGRRFILLVREGVKMPSNLQGLYEVRYSGDTLDAHSTIRLLEAIKDIKNYALPTDGDSTK